VWQFKLNDGTSVVASETRAAEGNRPGRNSIPVPSGLWETSGIVDASGIFGGDNWLLDIQAHGPTTPPTETSVEDGQLVLMSRG
jgi:hypothetical protein